MNPNGSLIKKEDCLLLLVDIQQVLLEPCQDAERLVRNTEALIDVSTLLRIPVLFSVHNAEKLGPFLPELTERADAPQILHKLEFNCLKNRSMREALEGSGKKTLILAGLEAHVCIFQTAVEALHHGFTVHVLADAVSSRSRHNWDVGLRRMERAGVVISSTEMAIFELLGEAGTPQFKAALPILKSL